MQKNLERRIRSLRRETGLEKPGSPEAYTFAEHHGGDSFLWDHSLETLKQNGFYGTIPSTKKDRPPRTGRCNLQLLGKHVMCTQVCLEQGRFPWAVWAANHCDVPILVDGLRKIQSRPGFGVPVLQPLPPWLKPSTIMHICKTTHRIIRLYIYICINISKCFVCLQRTMEIWTVLTQPFFGPPSSPAHELSWPSIFRFLRLGGPVQAFAGPEDEKTGGWQIESLGRVP